MRGSEACTLRTLRAEGKATAFGGARRAARGFRPPVALASTVLGFLLTARTPHTRPVRPQGEALLTTMRKRQRSEPDSVSEVTVSSSGRGEEPGGEGGGTRRVFGGARPAREPAQGL